MHLDYRQLSTVLAALRIMQQEIMEDGIESVSKMSHFDDVEAMTPDEIDILCDLLHSSPSQPVTPQPEDSETTPSETEARRLAIIDLADEQHPSEDISVDADAILSEGNDNGCYISAWLWVTFGGTPYDKDTQDDEDESPECTTCTDATCAWCQAEKQATA